MKRFIAFVMAWLASAGVALAAVNVNTASKEELESLKDIGPVKAQAIVDYRAQHGPFRSLEDLDKVKGIGKATLAAIRKDVTFSGENSGLAPMKRDNRAEDRSDARAQRGEAMNAPERVAQREEVREQKRVAANEHRAAVLDINRATEQELRDLPGVGAARARAIVNGRPYRSKDELVAKRILPENIYNGVKDHIVARHGAS